MISPLRRLSNWNLNLVHEKNNLGESCTKRFETMMVVVGDWDLALCLSCMERVRGGEVGDEST